MTRDEYVDLIAKTFKELGHRLLMEKLVAKLPLLRLPFFNPLTSLLVNYVLGELIADVEMRMFFLYTDFRVSKQGRAFVEAALKNQNAKPEQKADAEKAVIDAFRTFVRLSS
jgi:hypothetical protein